MNIKKAIEELNKLDPLERVFYLREILKKLKDKKERELIKKELEKTDKEIQDLKLWKSSASTPIIKREPEEAPQEQHRTLEETLEVIAEEPEKKQEEAFRVDYGVSPLELEKPEQQLYKSSSFSKDYLPPSENAYVSDQRFLTKEEQDKNKKDRKKAEEFEITKYESM